MKHEEIAVITVEMVTAAEKTADAQRAVELTILTKAKLATVMAAKAELAIVITAELATVTRVQISEAKIKVAEAIMAQEKAEELTTAS